MPIPSCYLLNWKIRLQQQRCGRRLPRRCHTSARESRTESATAATYTPAIGFLDGIKSLLTGAKNDAEAVAEGEVPAATPPSGADERETSTNAQMAGAGDEPWPGND